MTLPSGRCCVLPCIISFEFALSKSWMFCLRCPSDTRSWFLTKCRNWVVVQDPTDVKNVSQCAFVSISIFTFPSPWHYEVQFLAFVITLKLWYQCWCIGLLCWTHDVQETVMKHPVGCPVVTTISRGGWGWFGTIIIVYVLYALINDVNIGSGVPESCIFFSMPCEGEMKNWFLIQLHIPWQSSLGNWCVNPAGITLVLNIVGFGIAILDGPRCEKTSLWVVVQVSVWIHCVHGHWNRLPSHCTGSQWLWGTFLYFSYHCMFFAGMDPVCACHDDFYLQRQGGLLATKTLQLLIKLVLPFTSTACVKGPGNLFWHKS